MIEHDSMVYCKSLSQLSGVASKVVAEETEGEDFKNLLTKCIDTLSVYKGELRKLACISKETPKPQVYQLNESLYVYYKIVSHIASQVIPKLDEFRRIKSSSKKDSKDKELMEIYSRLVSALANDKQITEVKRFIKQHTEQVQQEELLRHFEHGDFISLSQLHSLIRSSSTSDTILLVDVRPRIDFNEGHIRSENIICIEPISFKDTYADSDIQRKSLITASEKELLLFKNRDKFRLMVLYTDTDEHTKYYWQQLEVLQTILVTRSFDKPLTGGKIVVLQNGINAWKRKYPDEVTAESHRNGIKKAAFSDHSFHSSMLNTRHGNHLTQENTDNHLSLSTSSLPYPSDDESSYAQYPETPKLSNGLDIKLTGLTPNTLLPSTSNLTKALQQSAQQNSQTSLPFGSTYLGSTNSSLNGYSTIDHFNSASASKDTVVSGETKGTISKSNINMDFSVGLVNLGNSCYLNCIIQCLLGCHELTYIFLTNAYKKHVNVNSRLGTKGLLANYFSQLVQNMYQQGKAIPYDGKRIDSMAVQPTQFKLACGSVNSLFKGSQQQDCQEFCQFLLDGLHEDLNQCGNNPPLKELTPEAEKMRETMPMRIASAIEWERYLTTDFSVIVDLFQGQYASQLKCKVCGLTSTTYQAFSVLSVPVPRARSCTIYDCFKEFTKLETLEKDELWYCPRCKKRQPSTKQILITRLPNNLIIHLKRFDNMMNKNNVFVNYPNELDLTGFWVNDYPDNSTDNGVSLPVRGQKPPFRYKLYAVASHSGTLYGGHYTSFVNKGKLGWCLFDDSSWRKVRREDEYITPNAYVLFYRRITN